MYGRDPDFDPLVLLPSGRIGLAKSADGRTFEPVTGPLTMGTVLEPSGDPTLFNNSQSGVSSIIEINGQLVMCYFGSDQEIFAALGEEAKGVVVSAGDRRQ